MNSKLLRTLGHLELNLQEGGSDLVNLFEKYFFL